MDRRPLKLRFAFLATALVAFSALPLSQDAPVVVSHDHTGRAEISGNFRNSKIVISTSARYAGAIESLTWNGQQFINSYDHGRGLQSAAQFGWGECLNPTEAGSLDDGTGSNSTSQLISLEVRDHQLVTQSRMAYWLPPGETSPSCRGVTAINKTRVSSHQLLKTVTIGARSLPNVIEHDVTFQVPDDYHMGIFESLTAYLPPSFAQFWAYHPDQDRLAPLTDGPGEQPFPVIIATPDGAYALGVYSPELPQAEWRRAGYGRWRFSTLAGGGDATVKWSCVFRARPASAGNYRFRCYSIVGTLDDVKASMGTLARQR